MRLSILLAWLLLSCVALLLGSCVDRYLPEVLTEPRNYLVVDGFINSQGITRIKLSRTTPLSTSSVARTPVESGASVFIESQTGTRTRLQEIGTGTFGTGTYTSPKPNPASWRQLPFIYQHTPGPDLRLGVPVHQNHAAD